MVTNNFTINEMYSLGKDFQKVFNNTTFYVYGKIHVQLPMKL